MRYTIIIAAYIFFGACKTQKRVDYTIPKEVSEADKKGFVESFKRGKALYSMVCANCHNSKKGSETIVPEFTDTQLNTYKIRLENSDHIKNLTLKEISEPEIKNIIFYLKHKAKKGTK